MHPREHPLLVPKNLLELLFQVPVWMFVYGSGLVILMSALAWLMYGLGQHIHPKLYPLPHVAVLDWLAESLIWVRTESEYTGSARTSRIVLLSLAIVVGVPVVFLGYLGYLSWLWGVI
jgi:hypothetical protein